MQVDREVKREGKENKSKGKLILLINRNFSEDVVSNIHLVSRCKLKYYCKVLQNNEISIANVMVGEMYQINARGHVLRGFQKYLNSYYCSY